MRADITIKGTKHRVMSSQYSQFDSRMNLDDQWSQEMSAHKILLSVKKKKKNSYPDL